MKQEPFIFNNQQHVTRNLKKNTTTAL